MCVTFARLCEQRNKDIEEDDREEIYYVDRERQRKRERKRERERERD